MSNETPLKDTESYRSACIIGPVLLGEGVIVEEGAVVVGPASIGARSIIASNAIVSRSFIWDDCVIGAGSSVDSSLLADRSVVIAGDQLKNATVVDSSFSGISMSSSRLKSLRSAWPSTSQR